MRHQSRPCISAERVDRIIIRVHESRRCLDQRHRLRTNDLPLEVLDRDLVAGLLVVVEPLALAQVDVGEGRVGVGALGPPDALGREADEFEAPAVDSEQLLTFRGVRQLVSDGAGLDVGRVLALGARVRRKVARVRNVTRYLAVLAAPDEIGLALASGDFVRVLERSQTSVGRKQVKVAEARGRRDPAAERQRQEDSNDGRSKEEGHTKRLMPTGLGWVSRQEVHWTMNM